MSKPTLQERLYAEGNARYGIGWHDEIARRRGLGNADNWENLALIGARIQNGEKLDKDDLMAIHKVWPAIPVEAIAERCRFVNEQTTAQRRVESFVEHLGFGASKAEALRIIDRVGVTEISMAVEEKRDERTRADTSKPFKPNFASKHNEDAADRRNEIARELARHDAPPPQSLREAKHQLANKIDLYTTAESEIRERERAGELRDDRQRDVAIAFDKESNTAEFEDLTSVQPDEEQLAEDVAAAERG